MLTLPFSAYDLTGYPPALLVTAALMALAGILIPRARRAPSTPVDA
ncbi:hypothetical protein ACIBI9_19295 [Nonomuraea sp. NPDC050451]